MAVDRHAAWSTNIGDLDFTGIVIGSALDSLKPVNRVNATVPSHSLLMRDAGWLI